MSDHDDTFYNDDMDMPFSSDDEEIVSTQTENEENTVAEKQDTAEADPTEEPLKHNDSEDVFEETQDNVRVNDPKRRNDQNVNLELNVLERITGNLLDTAEKLSEVLNMALSAHNYDQREMSDTEGDQESQARAEKRIGKASEEFQRAVNDANQNMDLAGLGSEALAKEGSNWRQIIEYGNQRFGMGRRSIPSSAGEKLTGKEAVYHMRSALGLSRPQRIPCIHSGFWVELSPPKIPDVALLCQNILSEKDSVGRAHKAVMLSSNSVVIREHLIEFILKHISATNYEHQDIDSLREAICLLDYPALIVGAAASLWPDNYPLQVPCLDNELKCQHINVFNVFIHRLTVFNTAALTSEQLQQLSQSRTPISKEKLEAYKAKMLNGEPNRRVCINEKKIQNAAEERDLRVYVTFQHPNLAQHIEQGKLWVQGINEKVMEEMASSSREETEEMIAREHSHWVKSYEVDYGNGNVAVIDTQEDIMEALETISEDQDILEAFYEALRQYMIDCTLCVSGIPRVRCEKCDEQLKVEGSEDPLSFVGAYDSNFIIPIDVESTFFTLALSKVTHQM